MPADALELNAAEALLELHFGPRRPPKDIKVEVEGAKSLPVNVHPTPNTPINSHSSYGRPIAHITDTYKNLEPIPQQTCLDVQQVKAEPNTEIAPQSPLNSKESLYNPINLAQNSKQGNLTNEGLSQNMTTTSTSGIKEDKMGNIVSVLFSSISSLEMQLKEYQKNESCPPRSELDRDVLADVQYEKDIKQNDITRKSSYCKTFQIDTTAIESDSSESNDEWHLEHQVFGKQIPDIQMIMKPRNKEMVPIGEGFASVPARLLKHMDWSSYTIATRKLLTAVFSRRMLATHSLTGKPSPAFPDKPIKKRLNTDLVNDIVQTVVERCGVPESVVRTSITTKCADESKMYRNRRQQKQKHWFRLNQENIPPRRYDDSFSE